MNFLGQQEKNSYKACKNISNWTTNSTLIKPTQLSWFDEQNNVFPSEMEPHSLSFV